MLLGPHRYQKAYLGLSRAKSLWQFTVNSEFPCSSASEEMGRLRIANVGDMEVSMECKNNWWPQSNVPICPEKWLWFTDLNSYRNLTICILENAENIMTAIWRTGKLPLLSAILWGIHNTVSKYQTSLLVQAPTEVAKHTQTCNYYQNCKKQ